MSVAIFLGLVQGITEWLPISSQGQLMSYSVTLLDITAEQALSYSIWLHIGTLMAAIIYFRDEIFNILTLRDKGMFRWLFIASLSTGITAVPLYIFIKSAISTYEASFILLLIGIMLILTGFLQRNVSESAGQKRMDDKSALLTGLAQGFSILPGISRSGTTVSVLLIQGFRAERSFSLSFLMSIPAVMGAELVLGADGGATVSYGSLLAVLVSFVVGYVTLERLINYAKKANFWKFCMGFGIFLIVLFIMYLV